MKIYLIDWNNDTGMVGGFYGDTLEQAFNNTKRMLYWSLEHTMELRGVKTLEIEILKNHEALNKLRQKKGLRVKPCYSEL